MNLDNIDTGIDMDNIYTGVDAGVDTGIDADNIDADNIDADNIDADNIDAGNIDADNIDTDNIDAALRWCHSAMVPLPVNASLQYGHICAASKKTLGLSENLKRARKAQMRLPCKEIEEGSEFGREIALIG